MFDDTLFATHRFVGPPQLPVRISGSWAFWMGKRGFDIALSLCLLAVVAIVLVVLVILNPFFNRGPLFFFQERMGLDCLPFRAIKFRTMTESAEILRRYDEPIERDRITFLGRFLRICRLDELPQVINVLKGEMSLIGPRPDVYAHAKIFLEIVPGYRSRHLILPGISGLAQVSLGYAEGVDATRAKTNADIYYIEHAGLFLDLKIVIKTITIVLFWRGN